MFNLFRICSMDHRILGFYFRIFILPEFVRTARRNTRTSMGRLTHVLRRNRTCSMSGCMFVLLVQISAVHCAIRATGSEAISKSGKEPMVGSSQFYRSDGAYERYTGDSANVSRLLDSLLKGYDKRLRPNYNGDPVEVGITMFVSSVSSISEVNLDFTLDFYFRQHWHDPRLNFTDEEDELCISNEMLERIWWPDTFFANAKQASFHTATTHNAFIRINPAGWITLSLRLTVTSMCPMDLKFFPMDTQICSLEIESYAYSVNHIAYSWKEGTRKSVGIDRNVQLPQFNIRGYRASKKLEILTTGNYSRLACQFYFVRSLGYYVIHMYVPSCLIVVLSWISFWLHRDASPARVALGITTVLTMTTLISSSNASLPKISYLKSIDIFLAVCFVMVFSSLLEYACVSYIGNRKWQPKQRKMADCESGRAQENGKQLLLGKTRIKKASNYETFEMRPKRIQVVQTDSDSVCTSISTLPSIDSNSQECSVPHPGRGELRPSSANQLPEKKRIMVNPNVALACNIDTYSRSVFPIIFLAFNVAYWVVFPNISPIPQETDFVFIN